MTIAPLSRPLFLSPLPEKAWAFAVNLVEPAKTVPSIGSADEL
jgi:hypothetical protein